MTALLRLHAWLLVAGIVLQAGMSVVLAQSPPTLQTLTVPPDRLPKGCQLEAPAPDAAPPTTTPRRTPVRSLPGNPWSGTDLALKIEARSAVDGQPFMPYAPATRRELGSFQAKWVENVAEAYRAQYESDGSGLVLVRAVRFNDPKWATPEPPLGTRIAIGGPSARVVLGAIVVRVSASANSECFQAVRKHLQSLTTRRM